MVIAGLLLCILNINLYSKNIGLIGVNTHYSFISSYYSIESTALEKEIDLSGMTHDSTRELGTLLNADYILIGAVIDYNSYSSTRQLFYIFEWLQITCSVGVTARLIDINTGEVIWVGSATDQSYSFQEAAEEILNILYETIAVK